MEKSDFGCSPDRRFLLPRTSPKCFRRSAPIPFLVWTGGALVNIAPVAIIRSRSTRISGPLLPWPLLRILSSTAHARYYNNYNCNGIAAIVNGNEDLNGLILFFLNFNRPSVPDGRSTRPRLGEG
jgi:hypothetical protein